MKRIVNIAFVTALALAAAACVPGDKFEFGKEVILINGTDQNPLVKLPVEDLPPATYTFVVNATGKVEEDVTVTLNVNDGEALEAYNKANNSHYELVGAQYYNVPSTTYTIKAGTASTEAIPVTLTDLSFMKNGVQYVIPVSIESVTGDRSILQTSRTIYIRLARTISFYALSMDNTGLYSEFEFPADKAQELHQYTYEVKCYPTNLKSDAAEQICRLCNFTGPTQGTSRQNMLRFNENGRPWRSLQIVTPSGGDYTTTTIFDVNQWYLLSMVWDGSTYQLYINGEPDGTTLTSNEWTTFARIELGMSWTSYGSSQRFYGRICEMRVWDYPRTRGQILNSLCGVDPASEGLIAYWKFNQSSGTTFIDETGHGYDMDWTKSIKEFTDGGGYQSNPSAANSISWVKDDVNKCSE